MLLKAVSFQSIGNHARRLVLTLGDITTHRTKLLFLQTIRTICDFFVTDSSFMKLFVPTYNSAFGFLLILMLVLSASGCGKHAQPPAVTNTNRATAEEKETLPDQKPAAQAETKVQPASQPDLQELDRSLLRWILANRRRPNNFDDFASTAGVSIPPPPAGKKYIIAQNMHIQLVDR